MRTKAELQQSIDDDLIWRRREAFELRLLIQDASQNKSKEAALLRAGVAMLYAHWEGFIKRSGTLYLHFVSNQACKGNELTSNFLAIKFKNQLDSIKLSSKTTTANHLINYFCHKLENKIKLPKNILIDTHSNLSSEVLKEINEVLGLDNTPYEAKKNIIDLKLVSKRNHIAHGNILHIDKQEFLEIYDEVFDMMDEFRNQVQNAAATDLFIRVTDIKR
ncbi:MAG: MAE_28990/MAE_18760 family HEPN-like nuclease [Brachymonas sp.]|nr:MAE_28990/MAE_18760 family HEPN-like nuclease [Brachymonas sp.]